MVKIEPLKSNNFVLFLGKGLSARNQTEVEIMTSRTMISKVVDALDSHITYSYRRNLRRESLSMPPFRLKSDVELPEMSLTVDILSDRNYSLIYDGDKYQGKFDKEHILPFGTIVLKKQNSIFENYNGDRIRLNITSKNKAIESLAANIHVEQAGTKSDLIYMVMTSENPFLADQHLYTLLNTYMDEGYVSKRNSLTQSREWIRQRLDTLSNDLSEIERDMNFYKQTNRTLNTNVETELFVRNAM